uniref:Retrotransposon gag domain-containing protein n=1 Tax=Cannabis sativa TaxID=3483 RepID=A0A803PIB0_CANSA
MLPLVGFGRSVSRPLYGDLGRIKNLFEEKFYNIAIRTTHMKDFVKLVQGDKTVVEYTLEFDLLSKFAGDLVPTDFTRKQKYVTRLDATISQDLKIITDHGTLYKKVVERALIVEEVEQQIKKQMLRMSV